MLSRFLKSFLALTICFYWQLPASAESSIAEIQNQYPGAAVKVVSPEEFKVYEKLYAQNSEVLKKTPGVIASPKKSYPPLVSPPTTPPSSSPSQDSKSQDPCAHLKSSSSSKDSSSGDGGRPEDFYYGPRGGNLGFNFGGGGGDSDKAVLVVLAVVGLVVVAAMVIYAVGYVASMSVTDSRCRAFTEMGYRISYITDNTNQQNREGLLNGVYFSTGFPSPTALLGVTAEIGYHSIGLNVSKQALGSFTDQYYGTYLMAGPSFTFPINGNSAFQIEWIAGTSTSVDIGLMSTMRFYYQFNFSPNFGMNLGIGAALINIKNAEGFLSDIDNLSYLTGLSAAVRF